MKLKIKLTTQTEIDLFNQLEKERELADFNAKLYLEVIRKLANSELKKYMNKTGHKLDLNCKLTNKMVRDWVALVSDQGVAVNQELSNTYSVLRQHVNCLTNEELMLKIEQINGGYVDAYEEGFTILMSEAISRRQNFENIYCGRTFEWML